MVGRGILNTGKNKGADMNAVLDKIKTEAEADVTVMDGAATAIAGIGAMVSNAVQAALANGASEAQLAPFDAVVQNLNDHRTALAQAIANVPA
jgi:antitoxin component of RelBE/YafQ-DinJ toxin-antitoxin module